MVPKNGISRREVVKLGAAAIGSTLTVAPAFPKPAHAGEVAGKRPTFYALSHGSLSNPFFAAQSKGFEEFCTRYNVDGRYVGTQKHGDIQEMVGNMETVVAAGGGDGMAIVFSNVQAQEAATRKAVQMRIPIVAMNAKDFRPVGQRIPYLVYIGEDSRETGQANAKFVLNAFKKLSGRAPKRSVYLIHIPGVIVLETRGQGMADILTKEGAVFDKVPVSVDPAPTMETVRAYIARYPDVETIHTGASYIAGYAIQALRELGRLGNVNEPFKQGKIYVGGIDINEKLLQEIAAGNAIGTIDQQPYMQGWYAAQVLYHWVTYRFLVGADIQTGPFVVAQTNASLLIDFAKKGIRA